MWGELLKVALDIATPIATSVATSAINRAMAPSPKAMPSFGAGVLPPQGLSTAANPGTANKTALNFQGGFTGNAPGSAVGKQGPQRASAGFRTLDRNKQLEQILGQGGSSAGSSGGI